MLSVRGGVWVQGCGCFWKSRSLKVVAEGDLSARVVVRVCLGAVPVRMWASMKPLSFKGVAMTVVFQAVCLPEGMAVVFDGGHLWQCAAVRLVQEILSLAESAAVENAGLSSVRVCSRVVFVRV